MSVNDLGRIAKAFAMSNLFGFKNESEAFSLMCIAQANGLHPAKAAERYHIIQGRPAMKADAMLSSFQESGGKVKWIKRTDTECKLWLSHPQGGELEVTWTIGRAQKAGLGGKDNWKKFPAQMLAARCVSEGVRALFPAELITDSTGPRVLISFGIFSVIRMERPAQLLVSATDYSVPDKECTLPTGTDNPCALVNTIAFPTAQFRGTATTQEPTNNTKRNNTGCGCGK